MVFIRIWYHIKDFQLIKCFFSQGGNPLDFRLRNAASVRVESTSLNDQPPEQFVTRFPLFLWSFYLVTDDPVSSIVSPVIDWLMFYFGTTVKLEVVLH